MKMYRTTYGSEIKERECVNVSEKSVFFINEHTGKKEHELLRSNFHNWHSSFEDAYKFLEKRLNNIIEQSERTISYQKEALKKLKESYEQR